MKILDLQTGRIHEYGTNQHDSLYVSNDGRYLTYYNLQNGDGSGVGDYRFVCDDDKVPAESKTADAIHAEVYFNIGGWPNETKAQWLFHRCSNCGFGVDKIINTDKYNYCPNCGADMHKRERGEDNENKVN